MKILPLIALGCCCSAGLRAQIDSSLLKPASPVDTLKHVLNMDAIYNRPFLQLGKSPVSIGGYVESDWQYTSTSGISLGNQFQFRRFSLFVASTISASNFSRRSNTKTTRPETRIMLRGPSSKSSTPRWTYNCILCSTSGAA